MEDTFKSDFPTQVFLISGILILVLGIVLGIFVVYPAAGISVTVVVIVVLAVFSLALFHMYHLTSGKNSKYVLKRYGQSTKMVLRTDLVRQEEVSSRFKEAVAEKDVSERKMAEEKIYTVEEGPAFNCPSCGALNKGNAEKCEKCGKRFRL